MPQNSGHSCLQQLRAHGLTPGDSNAAAQYGETGGGADDYCVRKDLEYAPQAVHSGVCGVGRCMGQR